MVFYNGDIDIRGVNGFHAFGGVRPALWLGLPLITSSPTSSPTPPPTADMQSNPASTPTVAASMFEKIEFSGSNWLVLEVRGDRALILSEGIIDPRQVEEDSALIAIESFTDRQHYHQKWEDVTWEHSTLRQWLNEDYINSFSADDRTRITESRIINSDNPWYGTPGGNDTTDRIFLLSIEEVVQYFGDSGILGSVSGYETWEIYDEYNSDRIAIDESGGECSWWLRSPGSYSGYAAIVEYNGSLYINGTQVGPIIFDDYRIDFSRCGIRPALWLKL